MTGMGNDGAKGLLAIRNRGGRTIGQDAATSAVYGMPKAAWDIGAVEKQAPLQDIPKFCSIYPADGHFRINNRDLVEHLLIDEICFFGEK